MNIHSINIPTGYNGTVQITSGKMHLERGDGVGGGYSFSAEIKFYYFCLMTPERRDIEFYLLRFPDGEWCDTRYMYPPSQWSINEKLLIFCPCRFSSHSHVRSREPAFHD